MIIPTNILTFPFLGLLSLSLLGTSTQAIHYHKAGSTTAYDVVPLKAPAKPTAGDVFYQACKNKAMANAARVRARTRLMVRTAAQGYNVRTVTVDANTPGIRPGADLFNGVDSTTGWQAVLDQAVAPGVDQLVVHVTVDFKAVTRIHSNTLILVDSGKTIYLPNGGGPNNNGVRPVRNYNQSMKRGQMRDHNIAIIGGNWNGAGPFQVANGPSFGWMGIFDFQGVDGLLLRSVNMQLSATFNAQFANCQDTYLHKCVVDGASANSDGPHLNGIIERFLIEDCDITAADDHIGINGADAKDYDMQGGGGKSGSTYYADLADRTNSGMRGIVVLNTRFGTSNVVGGGGSCGIRLTPGNCLYYEDMFFENISGVTHKYWLTAAYFAEAEPGRTVPTGGSTPAKNICFNKVHMRVTDPQGCTAAVQIDTDGFGIFNMKRDDFDVNNQSSFGFYQSGTARVAHHSNIYFNNYAAFDKSGSATAMASSHFYIGKNVVVSGIVEARNALVVREGSPVDAPFLQIQGPSPTKVDLTNGRFQNINEVAVFELTTHVPLVVANGVHHVGATAGRATFLLKSPETVVNKFTHAGYQGSKLLVSQSSQATITD